jgi:hypothetical protein
VARRSRKAYLTRAHAPPRPTALRASRMSDAVMRCPDCGQSDVSTSVIVSGGVLQCERCGASFHGSSALDSNGPPVPMVQAPPIPVFRVQRATWRRIKDDYVPILSQPPQIRRLQELVDVAAAAGAITSSASSARIQVVQLSTSTTKPVVIVKSLPGPSLVGAEIDMPRRPSETHRLYAQRLLDHIVHEANAACASCFADSRRLDRIADVVSACAADASDLCEGVRSELLSSGRVVSGRRSVDA